MKVELSEKTIQEIEDITMTDYNFEDNKTESENCISIIEDLILEYNKLREEFDEYIEKQDEDFE